MRALDIISSASSAGAKLSTTVENMADIRLNWTVDLDELTALLEEGDREQALAHASSIALVVICMLVGIVGNVIVCGVYSTKIGKSNTNMFILQLCAFDLFVCVTVMPFTLAVLLKTFTFLSDTLCKIYFYSTYLSTSASLLVLTAIALDRYNKVCRPLKRGITVRMTYHLFWITLFAGAVLSTSVPYVYGLSTRVYWHRGGAVVNGSSCGVLDSARGTMLHRIHVYTLFGIFVAVYCFIIMLYFLVAMRVHQRARRPRPAVTFIQSTFRGQVPFTEESRTSGTVRQVVGTGREETRKGFVNPVKDSDKREDGGICTRRDVQNDSHRFARGPTAKTSTMLIIVSVVFLMSWMPLWIILVRETSKEHAINWATIRSPDGALERFWRSLFLVNHAINPIIYSLFNKQFRHDCKLRMRKIRRRLGC